MMASKKIKLKVCGMRDPNNIMAVASLRPDYMGFIFFDKSPRNAGADFLLPENFPSGIGKVGVFVNESTKNIVTHAARLGLDYVQLHGQETVSQCNELKQEGLHIIKAFSVDDLFDFEVSKPYKQVADFFLFDTKGKYHGGNAVTFDWRILKRYDQEVPFFLSGGLTPDNMGDIFRLGDLNIHAVDVNSGFEISPALKDLNKLSAINNILTTNE